MPILSSDAYPFLSSILSVDQFPHLAYLCILFLSGVPDRLLSGCSPLASWLCNMASGGPCWPPHALPDPWRRTVMAIGNAYQGSVCFDFKWRRYLSLFANIEITAFFTRKTNLFFRVNRTDLACVSKLQLGGQQN